MRPRTVLAVTLTAVALLAVGAVVAVNAVRSGTLALAPDGCDVTVSEGTVRLAPDQAANAATIAAVGLRVEMPERAVTIALATALQESKLHNLAGGDRDSIGLFQQRPSQGWGRPDQLQDPRFASHAFYARLAKVRGWESMPVTQAAQAVQRSGSPDSYAQWETEAIALAAVLTGRHGSAMACRRRNTPSPDANRANLGAAIRADIGAADPSAPSGGTTRWTAPVAPRSGDGRDPGWRVATWFVAQSGAYDVRRVQFANKEWTAKSGAWRDVATPTANRTVIADVGP